MVCILPDSIKEMKAELKSRGESLKKIRKWSGQERIEFFSKFVDVPNSIENATVLNKRYESELVKPQQMEALNRWLKKIEKKGLDTKRTKMLEDKILAQKKLFDPKNEGKFYEELARSKLGFDIDMETSKAIYSATKTLNQLKNKRDKLIPNFINMTDKDYKVLHEMADSGNAEAKLKIDAILSVGQARMIFEKTIEEAALKTMDATFFRKLIGSMKTILTSIDVSFGRQMLKAMYADPKSNLSAWTKGFPAFVKVDALDSLKTVIYSHPYIESGKFEKLGLSFTQESTEFFPENWLTAEYESKTGKAITSPFRASERAFTVGVTMGKFNMGIAIIDNIVGEDNRIQNLDLVDKMKFKNAINQLYGRGLFNIFNQSARDKLGAFEDGIQVLALAPRYVMSQIHNLLDLRLLLTPETYARNNPNALANQLRLKSAVWNIAMLSVVSAGISALIASLSDDEEDERNFWDYFGHYINPQSVDFGRVVIGRMRLDLSGGTAAIIKMLSQGVTGKGVSTDWTTYKTDLMRTMTNWLNYKRSPLVNNMVNATKIAKYYGLLGENYKIDELKNIVNQEVSPLELALKGNLPISVAGLGSSVIEAIQNEGDVPPMETMTYAIGQFFFDAIGVSAQVYEASEHNPRNEGKSKEVLETEIRLSIANETKSGYSSRMFNSIPASSSNIMEKLQGKDQELAIKYRVNWYNTMVGAYINSAQYKTDTEKERFDKIKKIGTKASTETNKKIKKSNNGFVFDN